MRAFVVLVLVFPYQTKSLTWETSPKWPIFVEWDVKPQLSQSVDGQTWRHAENLKYITYRNTIIDYTAIPQRHVACTEKLAKLGCMVSEISARAQTDLHTVHCIAVFRPLAGKGRTINKITCWWLGSRVVSVLDSGAEGPWFKSQSRRCRVTVLGKLFTPIVPLFTKQQNW